MTSSCKYAAPKKDEKLTIFDQITLRFNNYNSLLPVSLVIIIIIMIMIMIIRERCSVYEQND